jgi:DNA repair exonuclease SbcCD ATPase subunit
MIHDPLMAQGAAQQLGAMIDRAQDERLRLMRIVKDYQARYDALPEPVSADHIKRVMDAVRKLDQAIADRMTTLEALDQRVDHRLDQLAQLEATLLERTKHLSRQLDEARGFGALVEAAKRQVRAAAAAARAEFENQHHAPAANDRHAPRILSTDPPERPLRNLAAIMNQRTG